MNNDSQILNVDYIDVLNEVDGLLKFEQIPIEHNGNEIVAELVKLLKDENSSLIDMQKHFTKVYRKKDCYRIPNINNETYMYNYCYPNEYDSRYIEGVVYPIVYTSREYRKCLNDLRKSYTKELETQYIKQRDEKEISLEVFNELITSIPDKVEDQVNNKIYSDKSHFLNNVKRYIQADNFYKTIQEIVSKDHCKMMSTERIGFTYLEYTINDDIQFIVSTNFGYGFSSYFYVNIRYKGIDILPYSDYVKYYYAGMVDFIRYTRQYVALRRSWYHVFSFVEETCNMAVKAPDQFIKKWINDELSEMMDGLRSIYHDPENEIERMIGKSDCNIETLSDHSICLRDISQDEIDLYSVYPSEMTIAYRVEKITGALHFLTKLKALTSLFPTIKDDIDEIKEMNKNLLPYIDKNMETIKLEIKTKKAKLKREEKKLKNLEQVNEYWYDTFKPKKYRNYSFVPNIEEFLKMNSNLRKEYNKIVAQENTINAIKKDIEFRTNFYNKLRLGKELIRETIK